MCKTIRIDYEESENDTERMKTIANILSDGVYSYLKAEGLLTGNDSQPERVNALLDRVRQIRASAQGEKNENSENNA